MKMPNKDNIELEKIIPALAAIGGAVGRAAMAGGRAMAADKLRGGGNAGGGDESEGLDEQDSHAQTEWENIHRSKSMQKLMNFVQIQKLGYAEEDRRKRPVRNRRGGGWNTRQKLGSQSAGLPAYGTDGWDKLLNLWERTSEGLPGDPPVIQGEGGFSDTRKSFPLAEAHDYLKYLQEGEDSYAEATMLQHLVGHQHIADVHNMMQFGDEWQLHPDRLEYMVPKNYDQITRNKFMGEDGWTNMGEGIQRPSKQFVDRMIQGRGNAWYQKLPFERFQQEVLPAVVSPEVSNQAKGMMDDLHRRIRMESSQYNPNDMRFPKLQSPRGAYDEDFGPERRTYHSEATPLPGQGEPSDAVDPWYDDEHDRNKRKFRGDDESSSGAHPFENFPYTETGEVGSDPDNYGIARRGINQGQLGRKDFDAIYGNPTKYGYDDSEGAETLPDEQLTQYPSAEERYAAHAGPDVDYDSTRPPMVPPSIPRKTPAEPIPDAFRARFPDLYDEESKEKAISKLMKFMRKEGGVGGEGGGFDGLSDTVFTSTNAGIFTPTYGGKGAKKNQRKNNKRQDKTRRKLMGKEKKSGVERLVQYLYDGSPHITKGGKMGLAPGLDDDMTGNAPTAHAGNNRTHAPHVPLENSSDLNHKRTSRPLEDAMEVAEKNEPHINMGLAGEMEASVAAAYPQEEDPSVSNGTTERKPEWRNKTYVQKSVNGVTTMISPDGNTESADGQHPQQRFIQRTKDNPNESPNEDAVLKENDMQRKRKQESNTEPEGSQPVAGLGLQMSSFGMNTYEQDSLARGGEEDTGHEEEDIDAKEEGEEADPRLDEDGSTWVPMNLDRTISLESMRKALEDAGDEAPLLTALYKLDYN
jgi:hypothetical protein